MSIREWFGCADSPEPYSQVDSALDQLLILYSKAISRYFDVDPCSAEDLIQAVHYDDQSIGNKMFLDWFRDKGLPQLQELLAGLHLPLEDADLIAELEYEHYILESEMDFRFRDNVRSCLMSIVSNMPDRIERARSREYIDSDTAQRVYDYNVEYKDPKKPRDDWSLNLTMLEEPVDTQAPLFYSDW